MIFTLNLVGEGKSYGQKEYYPQEEVLILVVLWSSHHHRNLHHQDHTKERCMLKAGGKFMACLKSSKPETYCMIKLAATVFMCKGLSGDSDGGDGIDLSY